MQRILNEDDDVNGALFKEEFVIHHNHAIAEKLKEEE